MLKGRLVLDCSTAMGWLAGRMLGDLGAEVVKIDPPGTDRSDARWLAYNVNKRPLTVDLSEPSARASFDAMVSAADIVIACLRPGQDGDLFDHERLSCINPQVITVVITAFGREGPRAGWRASDIELMAAGGAMSLAGEPGGMPLRVSEPQSYHWAGAQAAAGALLALNNRHLTGRGQLVDVSAQAAVVTALAHAPTFWDINRVEATRAGAFMTGRSVKGARYRVFWPCRDGHINFIIYGGVAGRRTNEQLVAWMGEAGHELGALADIDWARFDPTKTTQAEVDAIEAPMGRFFLTLTKREFLNGAHQREMLGYPVSTVADIADDPQLEARAFWQTAAGPDGRPVRHCGSFVMVDGQRPPLYAGGRRQQED